MVERAKADGSAGNEALNLAVIDEFRSNHGKVADVPGGNVLILHSVGAKTGEPRLTPLAFVVVDRRLFVLGSSLGAPNDPAWVHNLRAVPQARIEIGDEEYGVVAHEIRRDERDELFRTIGELVPIMVEHQARTARKIPIFELIKT
ncbi:MAG: nitroreductase/quinone reductase family protein [Mycobacterium sp.]